MSRPDIDELQRKAALAKSILDGVVDSSNHEDEKVGRILYSMSFLTVGTTIAFSAFLGNRIGTIAYGVDLVSVLFLGYILFLVMGTIIILEAMSPRLYLRPGRGARAKGADTDSASLDSMHFFKSIARKSQAEWLAYFKDAGSADLLMREYDDALRQAHFLSSKVNQKVEYIRKAKWIMLIAALFLLAMTVAGVLSYL
ncbi:MAG: hypothetical protein ACLQEQ_00415 [Nitrososphaerales archaeon]